MNLEGSIKDTRRRAIMPFDLRAVTMDSFNNADDERDFTVELVGYNGPWRHPEDSETTLVALSVRRVSGNPDEFWYIGKRLIGPRIGDKKASEKKPDEWYRIDIKHPYGVHGSSVMNATWTKVRPLQ